MKTILKLIIAVILSLNVYSQNDTLVRIDNRKKVGEVIEINEYSVVIETTESTTKNQIKVGKHIIAYIKYSDGELQKFKYNKWRRKANTNELLKNGFYFDIEDGYCLHQRTTWDTDPVTNQLHFSEKNQNIFRKTISVGNRWLFYKTDRYGLSIGGKWLNLSFSPIEAPSLFSSFTFYEDWIFTAAIIQPELTNTILLNKNSAIEHSICGGYMNHLGEATGGYSLNTAFKYRYKKLGTGISYTYGRTKDSAYGNPITLNTINITIGLKF